MPVNLPSRPAARRPADGPQGALGALGAWSATVSLLCALAACTATPKAPEAPVPPPQAAASPAAPASSPAPAPPAEPAYAPGLAAEQRWLDNWFRGTPVVIAQNDDGELIVEVPRAYCFDAGASRMRPALAAVLDKVALSLRRTPRARVVALSAPDDKAGTTALALQRAAQLHKRLVERGVAAAQLPPPTATLAAAVQLRIGLVDPR